LTKEYGAFMKRKNVNPQRFDSFAAEYYEFVTGFFGDPWLGWDDLSGEYAIDVGCGAGQTTEVIARKFDRVIGLDLSKELLTIAKIKHARENIRYIVGDFMVYPIDGAYDYVYSHTMMHHVENYGEGLMRLKSLVKKGGKLLIIDNVSDKYRTPPAWAYTIPAIIGFIPNIFRHGLNRSLFLLRFWHNKRWLGHLASDTYLNREEFKEMYLEVFPDGEIVDLGFANALKWIRR
jgi:SAM-dependent methyltransferase